MKDLNLDTDLSGDESESSRMACGYKSEEGDRDSGADQREDASSEPDPGECHGAERGPASAVDPEPEKPREVAHIRIEDFEILKVLGKGAYGTVFQVRKIKGHGKDRIYAMKAMNKARICGSRTDVRHTKTERNVLVTVEHEFIVKLHFAIETSKRLYLVQEFLCGGELFRRMEVERLMLERDAKFYLQEILLALEYLHSKDVIYRDLKTENVMLDKSGHVKLIDFGLSKSGMSEGTNTNTFCGTVEYMAPEVILRQGYCKPADWWSVGIFTFDLLTGRSPFHSNQGKQATKERILRCKFITPKIMTPEASDFVRKLLRKNIDRRMGSQRGADELKAHSFFYDTDWDKVLRKGYEPPFTPIVLSETDVQNFDVAFTSRSPRESNNVPNSHRRRNQQDEQALPEVEGFDHFDYVSDQFLNEFNLTRKTSDASNDHAEADDSAYNSRQPSDSLEQICDHMKVINHGE